MKVIIKYQKTNKNKYIDLDHLSVEDIRKLNDLVGEKLYLTKIRYNEYGIKEIMFEEIGK